MTGSITCYLRDLRNATGEADRERARRELWRRAYEYLVGVARKVVTQEDAEEVASDSLARFFAKAEAGEVSRLENRQDFWSLLHVSARNRALNRRRDSTTERRGGGHHRAPGEALDHQPAPAGTPADVDDPEEVWAFLEFLVGLGRDPQLREVAYLTYCEGLDPASVCRELGISQATYYRKHKLMLNAVEQFEEGLRHPPAD
jgi:RNA polymerase sigma factor (sigma-70 family)